MIKIKVAIVGSRKYFADPYPLLCENIPIGCSEIISGGATGIDFLAERYAKENGLNLTVLKPNYNNFKKAAPLIRNNDIIDSSDYVLALWNGESAGTKNVIATCLKINKPIKVVLIK